MLKGTHAPLRNKCKMLKVVYSIKKSQNVYLCYSYRFPMQQEISYGYTNEYLVMLFATLFTKKQNPPEVTGCEKNHPRPIIHKKSARLHFADRCSALFSINEKIPVSARSLIRRAQQ